MKLLIGSRVALFAVLTVVCSGKEFLTVVAISHNSQVNERSASYTTPGTSNTNCSGSATTMGNTTYGGANCQTTSTPPQTHVFNSRTIDVTNILEGNGMRYTVTCRAGWVGSNCGPMIDGDQFSAEIEGTTMWVSARRGGNQGKPIRIKYKILDIRQIPIPEPVPVATTASKVTSDKDSPDSMPTQSKPVTEPDLGGRVKQITEAPKGTAQLPEPPKAISMERRQLVITSAPTGAQIEVNGEFIGNTPSTVTAKEGSVTVAVKKAGYQAWQRTLTLSPGDKRTLEAELVKNPNVYRIDR